MAAKIQYDSRNWVTKKGNVAFNRSFFSTIEIVKKNLAV